MMAMSAALKCISFFVVANQINDIITAIKKNNIGADERLKYFKDHNINQEVHSDYQ